MSKGSMCSNKTMQFYNTYMYNHYEEFIYIYNDNVTTLEQSKAVYRVFPTMFYHFASHDIYYRWWNVLISQHHQSITHINMSIK